MPLCLLLSYGSLSNLPPNLPLFLSVATMDQCVRYFKAATDCSNAAALQAASFHPARVLGLEKQKGTLDYGADADMVVLDRELCVQATCIAGEVVWKAPNCHISGDQS